MTNFALVRLALFAAMATVIVGDPIPDVKSNPFAIGKEESNYKDPELLEYFRSLDTQQESTIANHRTNSLSRQSNRKLGENEDDEEHDDDDEEHDEDYDDENYANYVKEETHEHYEELITEDDDILNFLEDRMTAWPTSTDEPTDMPTSIGSSFWEGLEDYDHDAHTEDYYDSMDSEDYHDNTIIIKMSLGVVHYEYLTSQDNMDILGMVLRAMTVVLNNYSDVPFMAHDQIDHFDRSRNRNRNRNRLLQTFTVGFGFGVQAEVEAAEEPVPPRDKMHLADIVLDDVIVDQGNHGWWTLSILYSVYKNPRRNSYVAHDSFGDDGDDVRDRGGDRDDDRDGKRRNLALERPEQRRKLGIPVDSRHILTKIEGICNNAVQEAINEGVYWAALREVDFGNPDLLLNKHIYYKDEKGIVDCREVGDEYDLLIKYCPIDRPAYGGQLVCPIDPIMVGEPVTPIDENNFPVPDNNMISSIISGSRDPTYPEVIAEHLWEIEWGTREWVGLALMISTVVWTVILSVTAHVIFKRRKTQILWGNALTPNGVDDILKVGWRVYEQPPPQQQQPLKPTEQQQQQQQQQQFFLQIYDKGQGIGYNDENSVLRGGVEQPQIFAAGPQPFQEPTNQRQERPP